MAAPDYEVLVALTRTGELVDSLPVTAWTWSDGVAWADPGQMTVTVPLTGPDAAGRATVETLRSVRRAPWSLTLVLMRDQRAVWAGPAVTLGWSGTEVAVGCSSISRLLDRRMVIADGWYTQPWRVEGNVTLELTTRDLVIELIRRGTTGPGRDIPLDLPVGSGARGERVEYLAADLKTVSEALKQATERDDGPDVVIRPIVSLRDSLLRWTIDVGNPRIGTTESAATFDLSGAIRTLTGDVDGSEAVSTGYVLGDTAGTDNRLIGVAAVDRGHPYVALERADRTSVSEKRQVQLDALARSYVDAYQDGAETWALTVHADHPPIFELEWRLGDVISVHVERHPWLEDGTCDRRVVSVDATPDELTLHTVEVDA